MTSDYKFSEHGTITLVHPCNDSALAHLESRTGGQWLGYGLAVEPRYAPELSALLCRDGFAVELPSGRVVTAEDLI